MKTLKMALTTMRRSPYQSLVAVIMVAFTFFIGYRFSLLLMGAEHVLRHFETRPEVIAFFTLETDQEAIEDLEKSMNEKSYVERVTVVSQEEALKIYREENQAEPLLLELVTADIFPASIEISGNTPDALERVSADLEESQSIEEVVYQKDVVDSLTRWTKALRREAIQDTAMLGLISFLIITVIISMKMATKKSAIRIMRLLGATKWFVKAPFVLEGVLYAVLGSLIGWAAMTLELLYRTPEFKSFLGDIILLPVPPEILAIQLGIGTLIGVLLGAFAGATAVGRFIRS